MHSYASLDTESWRGPCVVVVRLKNMKALSRAPVLASHYRRPILVYLLEQ